ncbi:MAG: regulatory iron-sulfur-containing complex subunit RicT [Candidatus Saganbacteria bacterium]|nr:regulatory iron-sulfur-containing complex subunit RicT [Candidatus Saganbacteria bacterium]
MKHLAIRLRKFGRICPIAGYKEEAIKIGALVIVMTDRGEEIGQIIGFERGLPHTVSKDVRLKKVLRYATEQDVLKAKELIDREEQALKLAFQKVQEYEIPVKLVNVEILFDGQKAIFYYKLQQEKKSPNLKLISRDISDQLKIRVDFKQVSPRDEARFIGGLGPCGRPLCCATWLDKPKHITVKMVKEQGFSLSPLRTSGICGRLMCCLGYEHEGGAKEEKK